MDGCMYVVMVPVVSNSSSSSSDSSSDGERINKNQHNTYIPERKKPSKQVNNIKRY